MVILRFRSEVEHEDLLKKVKKMKKFATEIEDCLYDHMEDDYSYRENYDDEEDSMKRMDGRYAYAKNMRSRRM